MKLAFRTPAKINLYLKILSKRDDGFHELETLFQMVDLYDEIELETRSSGIHLECDHPEVPGDESNLVSQAGRMLLEAFPKRKDLGVKIRLVKNIPSGAGLGGGSGNAAGVLMGLNKLWDLKLPRRELANFASRLGSDVPFFLGSPCALGRGKGDLLTPVQLPKKFNLILIYPRFAIPTLWVYRNFKLELTKAGKNISILQKFFSHSDFPRLGPHFVNDLEPVVIQRYPVVQVMKDTLNHLGAEGSLMSGSGSAVFGIFSDNDRAKDAQAKLNQKEWDVFLVETVSKCSQFLPEEIINYP